MPRFLITAVLAFLASTIAKVVVDAYVHAPIHIVGTFAGLYPTHNAGVAFGFTLPPLMQELLILAALGFVCILAWKTRSTLLSQIGYGLIVGGALENIIDRIPDGVVTDFIQVGSFAVFNVADSCITIGAVFLLAEAFGIVRAE